MFYEVWWLVKDENGGYEETRSVYSFANHNAACVFAAKMVLANKAYFQGFMIVCDAEILCRKVLKEGV